MTALRALVAVGAGLLADGLLLIAAGGAWLPVDPVAATRAGLIVAAVSGAVAGAAVWLLWPWALGRREPVAVSAETWDLLTGGEVDR